MSGPAPVSVDSLMERAEARAGGDDWGDLGFAQPLGLLVEACRETARLTPAGWDVLARTLLRHLANRLALQAHLRSGPPPAPIAAGSLVVTGLPRTGTTLLHNLLARDRRYRFLRLWEALRPAAVAGIAGLDQRREVEGALVAQAETWLARFRALVPGFQAIRPADVQGPEECDALLQNSFASLHFDDMWDAEAYSRWFHTAGLAEEYRYYGLQLASIASADAHAGGGAIRPGARPWALKSPGHLGHLDALLAALPDATVLVCHRHPAEAVASWASLVRAVRAPHTERLDQLVVGAQVLDRAWLATERAMSVRDAVGTGWAQTGAPSPGAPSPGAPSAVFVDVAYPRLVRQPLEVVAEVYAGLGQSLAPEVRASMGAWLAENPQHGHGPHRYGLEEIGLSAAQVCERFAPYLERFGGLVEA